ncbi:hypothetical protein B0J14DRAFT_263721 [Halenospora varia]|nr:hypothetical protein B0J14DRAFT_263721 [Halenospora varia]
MSEDARSLANSEGSGIAVDGKKHRKRLRSSTSYHLAHPAPTLTKKQKLLQIRPRLLLQLQRLSADSRPKPAIDVIPSTLVAPRFIKKFPRMFRGKAELGANDFMVLKSEEYDLHEDQENEEVDSDEEGLINRDLLAVICQLRKDCGGSSGKAEMVLKDGSVWTASPLPNNLYEFVTIDERGDQVTARWVKRSNARKSTDLSESTIYNSINNDVKFTFSIIDPNSRKHPIMATLTQNKLDIPDTYTSVSSSVGKFPPTSPMRGFPAEKDCLVENNPLPERSTHTIDANMKTLIQVTGIWVALRQGWSPYFKYTDVVATSVNTTIPNSRTAPNGRARSMSLNPEDSRASPVASYTSTPESTPGSIGAFVGGRLRRSCARGSPVNGKSSQLDSGPSTPKRSVSAGTAFMQRAAARKGAGTTPSTVASDSEGEGIFQPPRRAVTEATMVSKSIWSSTPASQSSPTNSGPNTPTRPQRRPHSVYVPTSNLQHGFSNGSSERHSLDVLGMPSDVVQKPKLSRWKTFTNIFRRTNSGSRA